MAKSGGANPTFPTKPCPKCSKPIHSRKMSHDECGWVAETMPTAAKVTKPAATAMNGKAPSKFAAVRQILTASGNDTMPAAIQDQLKKQFKITMELPAISNYKCIILKGAGKKKLGRPKGSTNAAKATPVAAVAAKASIAISMDDVRAVKKLIDAIGAEKVKELASVLA